MPANPKEQQFFQAYESYADMVFDYCHGFTSNRNTALAQVQEVFCKLWEQISVDESVVVTSQYIQDIATTVVATRSS